MKAQEANLPPRKTFKVSGFIPVIVQLWVSVTERLLANEFVRSKFGILNLLRIEATNL